LERHFEDKDPPIPQQIAGYKIEGLLTKGGMSLLYLGTHPKTLEPILIKVLLPKFLKDKEITDRFLNEAKIIAKTNHPNIVTLYNFGSWEGGLYIAMEFVKGTSLRKILTHQPFSLKRALEILLQIAYAICHLHTHGVVHGDVKPENILINESGQVKLIDFGIARILTDNEKKESSGRLIGTPIYMSPEQLENWQSVSCQSDMYSLGIIAYELALGKIAHGRVILSLAPKGLQKILHKMLQPKPEDRYSDMADFIADLSGYIKSGSYQKDKQGSDYFLELFETLERYQSSSTPQNLDQLEALEIGLVSRQSLSLSGQYYDCAELADEKYALFVAEAPHSGVEGILSIASIRTLFKTLVDIYKQKPIKELVFLLYTRMQKELLPHTIPFCIFIIDTKKHTWSFFHNNYGILTHHSAKENAEALERSDVHLEKEIPLYMCTATFSHDDLFVLAGCQKPTPDIQKIVQHTLQETLQDAPNAKQLPCQKLAESIIRKLDLKNAINFAEEPLVLMVLRAKQ